MSLTALRKYEQVSRSLQPIQRIGIRMALRPFLMRGGLENAPVQLRWHAASVLRSQFPRSSPGEIDLLTFCFLTRVAATIWKQGGVELKRTAALSYEEVSAMRDCLTDNRDSLEDLNDQDLFSLERAMERAQRPEIMISHLMTAAGDTQGLLADNVKG
jgi:hypothetical protein